MSAQPANTLHHALNKIRVDQHDHTITRAVAKAIGCPEWTEKGCDSDECFCLKGARAALEQRKIIEQRKNVKLTAALQQCEDYFENRADVVDGSYGVPAPNREMSILSEIREALGRA